MSWRRITAEAEGLPELTGTENQVRQASAIRAEFLDLLVYESRAMPPQNMPEQPWLEHLGEFYAILASRTDAPAWIEGRDLTIEKLLRAWIGQEPYLAMAGRYTGGRRRLRDLHRAQLPAMRLLYPEPHPAP